MAVIMDRIEYGWAIISRWMVVPKGIEGMIQEVGVNAIFL